MKILYILNPKSNGGKTVDLEEKLLQWDYPSGCSVDLVKTKREKHATEIAQKEAKNYDIICAVGGDGTFNEVAAGIFAAKEGTLGLIPSGTGNDTVKGLQISSDFDESIRRLLFGEKKLLDAGTVSVDQKDYFFINISSLGFDAKVVEVTNKIKNRIRNSWAYKLALVYTFFGYQDISFTIPTQEEVSHPVDGKLLLFAVGNGRYYGGGFQILPQAKWDDGYFDVCMVKNVPRWKLAALFPSIFSATHSKHTKYVSMYHTRSFTIQVHDPFLLNLDGELVPFEAEKRVQYQIHPKALTIMV